MILVDANLLIYASVSTMLQHTAARDWLDRQIESGISIAIPWLSLDAYLRVVTNRRLFDAAASIKDAVAEIENWLENPNVWIPHPSERHLSMFRNLAEAGDVSGNLVPDALLAALAIDHGLTLCSADRDFARFPGLRWINPLAQ